MRAFWVATLVALVGPVSSAANEHYPFSLHHGHLVLVRGSIGPLAGSLFAVDTGSGRTVLSSAVATALQLRCSASRLHAFGQSLDAQECLAATVDIAGFQAAAHRVLVTDLTATSAALQV